MKKKDKLRELTPALIGRYAAVLREQEKAPATVQKYVHDLTLLCGHLGGAALTKAALIGWKEYLTANYAAASVNTMLAAANGLFDFCGWTDLKVKPLKIQKSLFCNADKELTREEYIRLIRAAEQDGNQRLSLVIQTICATGIRVSEVRYVTVETARTGRAEIALKGKIRTILLPEKLCRKLLQYAQKQKTASGAIFRTKSGKELGRRQIWAEMKSLCKYAGVMPGKVFPHNLRHMFATVFYRACRDIVKLSDLLGHSSIETTRIYLLTSGAEHQRTLDRLGLIS